MALLDNFLWRLEIMWSFPNFIPFSMSDDYMHLKDKITCVLLDKFQLVTCVICSQALKIQIILYNDNKDTNFLLQIIELNHNFQLSYESKEPNYSQLPVEMEKLDIKKSYWLLPLCQGSTSFGDVLLHTAAFWRMRTLIMQKITDRHRLYRSAEKNDQLDQPSLDLQILYIVHIMSYIIFSTFLVNVSVLCIVMQMRGEELKELSMEELKGLEQLVERGLNRVIVMKHEKIMNEISVLERKTANLLENARARFAEQGQSCESAITNNCSATNAPSDPEVSDISLKLGWSQVNSELRLYVKKMWKLYLSLLVSLLLLRAALSYVRVVYSKLEEGRESFMWLVKEYGVGHSRSSFIPQGVWHFGNGKGGLMHKEREPCLKEKRLSNSKTNIIKFNHILEYLDFIQHVQLKPNVAFLDEVVG
ncbi:Transcription factor, K-box [Dillenia turbinata]|uniref:Transcription factor, K-box n=1 Tax=Dillenia turbinata TaxID=194707 RepID=A0AAN8WBY0_9MAGN